MTVTDNAAPPATTTAREYVRVSMDRSGRARSLNEQHTDNAAAAEREGWTLRDPYRDESISASRYSTKVRGGFAELLADLDADRFGADVLVLWESSRGSRKVGEWVELIEACERRKVRIYVTTHGRTYDPTNGRDRRSLLEDAVDSEYESSKVSARAKRAAAANAAAGRPVGQVPFGFRRIFDPHTRRYVTQEPHPDEAPVIVELFARITAGHSLRSIAADFAARGIERRSGGPFTAKHLRSMALNAAYAALRVHDVGRKAGESPTPNARTTPGDWTAIIGETEYHAVQRILRDPARRTNRPGRGRHLLSMIATCAECGSLLVATHRASGGGEGRVKRRQYQCQIRGCVRVDADDLDGEAADAILGYLSRTDVHDALTAGQDDATDEIEGARAEVARVRAELDELSDAVGRGDLSATLAARSEPQILARLRAAEDRVRDLQTPSALRGLIEPGADVVDRWLEAPMSTRREVARLLLAPDLLGTLAVRRRPEGRRGGRAVVPAAERIEWRRDPA